MPRLAQMRFSDRDDAGDRLGARLRAESIGDPVVVGMARGGIPVAARVAAALGAPLDIVEVQKIGAPGQAELAIGAIAEPDVVIADRAAVEGMGVGSAEFERLIDLARDALARKSDAHGARTHLPLAGRTAILVDDGLATGLSARAAARSLRVRGAARVILAVPVCAPQAVRELERDIDRVISLVFPRSLVAVGLWYDDFRATSDAEIAALLAEAA